MPFTLMEYNMEFLRSLSSLVELAAHPAAHVGLAYVLAQCLFAARVNKYAAFSLIMVAAGLKELGDPTFSVLDLCLAAGGFISAHVTLAMAVHRGMAHQAAVVNGIIDRIEKERGAAP
jgi:hypothetical protein